MRQHFNTPIASLWAISVLVALAVVITLWLTAGVAAKSQELAFKADRQMLASGQEIKVELQQKIAQAQQEKANRLAEDERIAEEEARQAEEDRLAEERRQARLVARHRSQSSARSQASAPAQPATAQPSGVAKKLTAYTSSPYENGGSSNTASGKNLDQLLAEGKKVVASNDYALGTEIKINVNGASEWYTVEDRMAYGGVVDVLVSDSQTARNIGRRNVVVEEVR
ncbi:hypothetical protein ACFL0Z_02940 [Patescibacteria group bacterium]